MNRELISQRGRLRLIAGVMPSECMLDRVLNLICKLRGKQAGLGFRISLIDSAICGSKLFSRMLSVVAILLISPHVQATHDDNPEINHYAHSDSYYRTYADAAAACQASLVAWPLPNATCAAGGGFAGCMANVGDGFLNTRTGDQFLHCTNGLKSKTIIGCSTTTPATPHPISIGVGNKYLVETIYAGTGSFPLFFKLSYNSYTSSRWQSNPIGRTIKLDKYGITAAVQRGTGQSLLFSKEGSAWVTDADVADRLIQLADGNGTTIGWTYTNSDDQIESYSASGYLNNIRDRNGFFHSYTLSDGTAGPNGGYVLDALGNPTTTVLPAGLMIRVSDTFGRSLTFGYDSSSRITKLTDSAGEVYQYAYDAEGSLVSVTYPDGLARLYHYENATFKRALTGITDENGVRYITYTYDAQGRAVGEVMYGGADSHQLSFGINSTTVTDPLGTQRTYNFQTILGVVKSLGQSQPAGSGCGASASALNYDANGNIASRTDFNGNKTTYVHDLSRNLETSRTEGLTAAGAATPATRTLTTTWHATWRLPVEIAEYAGPTASGTPLKRTTYAYDSRGNLTQRSETDPVANTSRSTTIAYTYSTAVPGLVLSKVVDGPRSDVNDVTTYSYYDATDPDLGRRGNLASVTDALGHVWHYTAYNAHGQLLTMTDPNGLVTSNTYDVRQRLTSRTVGSEATNLQYDGVGQVTELTLPDGSALHYTYDAAHRLTDISDSQGNAVHYTLDAMGNRTREDIKDPGGQLARTLTRSYDALNRLQTLTGVGLE